jgi:DNA-binding LacI/PurR family transcriptional regulator
MTRPPERWSPAQHGLVVPRDISICGFDDSWARSVRLYLTTVYQPIEEQGHAAATLLVTRGPRRPLAQPALSPCRAGLGRPPPAE